MTVLGLLVGLIGTDINSGALRFTFGLEDLPDGLNFVAISMGIFGYAEIMNHLEARQTRNFNTGSVGKVLPTWADIKNCFGPIVRGTAIGSILGVLPGGGALLSPSPPTRLKRRLPERTRIPRSAKAISAASRARKPRIMPELRHPSSRC
ncbi:MAG: tripartite tricarboxylate transporter permease [Dakarella massiliensis]